MRNAPFLNGPIKVKKGSTVTLMVDTGDGLKTLLTRTVPFDGWYAIGSIGDPTPLKDCNAEGKFLGK